MAQRGQFPSNLIQDILTEQHQLSQQQQNMLGIYSNMDREWTQFENKMLGQALTSLNESGTNEITQPWLENLSSKMKSRTPEDIAKKIILLNKKQQMYMSQNPNAFQESGDPDLKKRKRIDKDTIPQEKERKRSKHQSRQQLLELIDSTDEDVSDKQENIIGSILEENQEHILSIRRNINNGNSESNEQHIKEFKANISSILKTMQNMKGIMAHMSPIDDYISGIDWDT